MGVTLFDSHFAQLGFGLWADVLELFFIPLLLVNAIIIIIRYFYPQTQSVSTRNFINNVTNASQIQTNTEYGNSLETGNPFGWKFIRSEHETAKYPLQLSLQQIQQCQQSLLAPQATFDNVFASGVVEEHQSEIITSSEKYKEIEKQNEKSVSPDEESGFNSRSSADLECSKSEQTYEILTQIEDVESEDESSALVLLTTPEANSVRFECIHALEELRIRRTQQLSLVVFQPTTIQISQEVRDIGEFILEISRLIQEISHLLFQPVYRNRQSDEIELEAHIREYAVLLSQSEQVNRSRSKTRLNGREVGYLIRKQGHLIREQTLLIREQGQRLAQLRL